MILKKYNKKELKNKFLINNQNIKDSKIKNYKINLLLKQTILIV